MLFNFEGPEGTSKEYGGVPEALRTCGGVAQLGEHLPCKQGVRSSILLISTKPFKVEWGSGCKGTRTGKSHGLIAQVVRAHA